MARAIRFWLLLLLLVAAAALFEQRRSQPEVLVAGDGESVHVIDGDSLRIGGREIRLAGIDAPEYRQTCPDPAGPNWPCGREARSALERLVRAGGLRCSSRAEDRYGRQLSQCTTSSGDVAAIIAIQGWAMAARDPRYDVYGDEIATARAARRGIWRADPVHPADWRKEQEKQKSLATDARPAAL